MTKVAADAVEIEDAVDQEIDKKEETGSTEESDQREPEDAVEELKRQIKREEERRIAAEEQLRSEREDKKKIQMSSNEQQLDAYDKSFDDALALKNKEIDDIQNEMAAAMDEGDHKKVAQLQTKLYKSIQAQEMAEAGKNRVKEIREQLKNQKSQPAEEYTQEAKKWIDEHPRFSTDEDYQAEAIAAHHVAVRKGIKMDSPEYFAFIEKRLESSFPEEDVVTGSQDEETDKKVEKKPSQSRVQSMAAPSRSGSGEGGGSKKRIRATPGEVEAAEICGMSLEEYMKDKYGE